jgi:hypothetical protein
LIERGTIQYINEGSVIGHGNTLIYAARREQLTRGFRFYISTDNGLTWSIQGDSTFGDNFGSRSHPPYLDKFKINGQDVFACYYVNRTERDSKVIYGKPEDVIAGVDGWNVNTKLKFMDYADYPSLASNTASLPRSGYGMVSHINNDMFARGMAYMDYDIDVPSNILYFNLPTTHYDNVKNELGII